ncbi:exonuclease domain-containing protein [Nocardia sp. 004]|uniref:exonuclease domain-containing protein n=1 Tax=Nocardia sp. 004 TaxID=3385978 RepID=UPI0039A36103
MNSDTRLLNVVDVEATCWEGKVPVGMVSEIIEIGLTVVDLDAGERIAEHRILVRPARSTVSEFCTELTGLTQDEVDTGMAFSDACRLLASEHRSGTKPWASWGDYDRKQFERQCAVTNAEYPFGQWHTNAKWNSRPREMPASAAIPRTGTSSMVRSPSMVAPKMISCSRRSSGLIRARSAVTRLPLIPSCRRARVDTLLIHAR